MPQAYRLVEDHRDLVHRDEDAAHPQYLLKTGQDAGATHYTQEFQLGLKMPLVGNSTGIEWQVDNPAVAGANASVRSVLHNGTLNMFFGGRSSPNAQFEGGLIEFELYNRAGNRIGLQLDGEKGFLFEADNVNHVIDAGGLIIRNLLDPVQPQDATPMYWVESYVQHETGFLQPIGERGIASGYAPLDANSKVPAMYLPPASAVPNAVFDTRDLMVAGGPALLSGQTAIVHLDPDPAKNGEYLVLRAAPTLLSHFQLLGLNIPIHRHSGADVDVTDAAGANPQTLQAALNDIETFYMKVDGTSPGSVIQAQDFDLGMTVDLTNNVRSLRFVDQALPNVYGTVDTRNNQGNVYMELTSRSDAGMAVADSGILNLSYIGKAGVVSRITLNAAGLTLHADSKVVDFDNASLKNLIDPIDQQDAVTKEYLENFVPPSTDVRFQSYWNADANVPAIPDAAPDNKGWYYVVENPGDTEIEGITEWNEGDWLVSNGLFWDKLTRDSGDVSTGLELIDGAVPSKGWRLIGRDPLNYSDIGDHAVDLSHQTTQDGAGGAQGHWSFATGLNTFAEGVRSFSTGTDSHAEGDDSHSSGKNTHARGANSHAEGDTTVASADGSHAEGVGTVALNAGSHAEGLYNVGGSPDTVSEIGIGTGNTDRKNAFEAYKNGVLLAPEETIAIIDAADAKVLLTKEWIVDKDFQQKSEKGVASGYASLDANAAVPVTQLPPSSAVPHHVFTSIAAMLTGGGPVLAGEYSLVYGDPDSAKDGGYVALQDRPTTISHWYELAKDVKPHRHDGGQVDVTQEGVSRTLQYVIDHLNTVASTGGMSGMAVGSIMMWATDAAPTGWLICNGSHFDAVTYQELYALLGDDTLPNFTNQFVRGVTAGRAVLSTQDDATSLPTNSFALGSAGVHNHNCDSGGKHMHVSAGHQGQVGWKESSPSYYMSNYAVGHQNDQGATNTRSSGLHSHYIRNSSAHTHSFTGGDTETRPANIAIYFIIKATAGAVTQELKPVRYEGGRVGQLEINLNENVHGDALVMVNGKILSSDTYTTAGKKITLGNALAAADYYTVINYVPGSPVQRHEETVAAAGLDVALVPFKVNPEALVAVNGSVLAQDKYTITDNIFSPGESNVTFTPRLIENDVLVVHTYVQ